MKKDNKLNVGIIIGGRSVEHDISILSGLQVYHAIDKSKYNVSIFYITKDLRWLVGDALKDIITYEEEKYSNLNEVCIYKTKEGVFYRPIKSRKKEQRIDLFIPVVHGDGIEDGTLIGYLDMLDIPHTASKLTTSAIIQDKILTKQILSNVDIPLIKYICMTSNDNYYEILEKVKEKLGYPVIIKPARLGSSIGITTANDDSEFKFGVEEALKYGTRILIEKKIQNMKEYNIAIISNSNKLITSCIEEVNKTDDILSFIDKYERDDKLDNKSNRQIPAILSKELEEEIINICTKAYIYLDINGVTRIDTIYDIDKNKIYINEINTIPGSLAFYLFEKKNIDFTMLVNMLIKDAILTKQKDSKRLKTFVSNVLNKKCIKLNK